MLDVRTVIQSCFENPKNTLGKSEDSCYIKIVFMLLWELGWNPVNQIMLGFEIPKERMGSEQRAAVVPDIVVADQQGTYLVGEVKHWYVSLGEKHMNQVRGYQRALDFPMAFLTNGHHWIVLSTDDERPIFDRDFSRFEEMISELKVLIGPTAAKNASKFPYNRALDVGLSMSKSDCIPSVARGKETGKILHITWDWDAYPDNGVREFVRELNALVREKPGLLNKDAGEKSLMIKDRRNGLKLIEYWPHEDKICGTPTTHKQLGIDPALTDTYHKLIYAAKGKITNKHDTLSLLKQIVADLERKRKSA